MNAPVENPWSRWEAALRGEKLDLGERGNPPWGYFRFPQRDGRQEAVAVWRDEAGELQCSRNIYGSGEGMTAMQIDEMFASEHYAIPVAVFDSVVCGDPWPEVYTTRLRTKDITDGVCWSVEWSRAQLAANVETHDEEGNPRAVIGGNNPPPDELPPFLALRARVDAIGEALKGFLAKIGGAPRTKAEADAVANYATAFKDRANEATAAHKVEKQPHLDAGRVIDNAWFPVRDHAEACRKKALAIADVWITAEKGRLAEEARKANETARKEAARVAELTGDAPAPVAEVAPEPVKLGTGRAVSQRTRKVWAVSDAPAFVAYLLTLKPTPPVLADALETLAQRMGTAGVAAPGIALTEKVSSQ